MAQDRKYFYLFYQALFMKTTDVRARDGLYLLLLSGA